MPTPRDWFHALLAIVMFFLALGVVDPAPAAVFDGVDQERTMERYLTEAEQERFLRTLKERACVEAIDRRDAAAFKALMHSGLRIGEFSRITVGQALEALRTGYLFIPREHRKGRAHDHMVFVTQALREDLQDLLKARHEINEADCHEDDPLVIGRTGDGMTVRALELRFKQWAELAGLPPRASPHWLRHTRAMNIVRRSTARNPLGVAQSALGHVSIRSTGVYTKTPREDVEAALTETDGRVGRVSRRRLRAAWEGRTACS